MKVTSLRLEHFRNIASADIKPSRGMNILFGDNAQGKTNLLEAIWLFTGARSFRGTKDASYVRFGQEMASLHLGFHADGREQSAELRLAKDKKSIALNGIKQETLRALSGSFSAVLFSPDHLWMVKQGPESRRRVIDAFLCQGSPKYTEVLDKYGKILRQRAKLLRDISFHSSLFDLLDAWDTSLVEYGSYITHIRRSYIEKLSTRAGEIYSGISHGKESLGISYVPGFATGTDWSDRTEVRERFRLAVAGNREQDVKMAANTVGPHRDDMEMSIDGKPAREFGSQGQQRSCVLALKLAECGILQERNGEPPVVMLDDVMSELDEGRRSYLLNRLKRMQVFVTCCDASTFDGLQDGQVYRVEEGEIRGEGKG